MKFIKRALALLLFCSIAFSVISIPASAACGHSMLGPTYCEDAHPHRNYTYCLQCYAKIYLNGYTTKAHTTCPSCGTHTYVGLSCTAKGTCACGATKAATGHTYGTTWSEAAHPHRYYRVCQTCRYVNYPGGNATKNHGDGTYGSGTCPSCGTHSYEYDYDAIAIHPHPIIRKCKCGNKITVSTESWPVASCATCSSGSKSVSSSNTASVILTYLDGEEGIGGFSVSFPVQLSMQYNETYKKNGSKFGSFSSKSYCSLSSVPAWAPDITLIANAEVKYYSSSGTQIFTSTLSRVSWTTQNEKNGSIFSANSIPSYSIAGYTVYVDGSMWVVSKSLTTYYTY